jgi:hypothetical protein
MAFYCFLNKLGMIKITKFNINKMFKSLSDSTNQMKTITNLLINHQ